MIVENRHGNVIVLWLPKPQHLNKQDSEFIFDKSLSMWCLKSEYDKINIEEDNLSNLPMINQTELELFGLWKTKQ